MSNDIFSEMTPPTILIVDDCPTNLGVAVEQLEVCGYRVVIAQEGEEGIQRAAFVQPDIILLDVLLPGLSGFDICLRLKAHDKTCRIPVIFMTALMEDDDKVLGFDVGAIDYITKPLRIKELLARVETHLKISKMQKQLELQNRQLQQHREALERLVAERTFALGSRTLSLETEIHARQNTEAALQESERQYRSLVENTPDTVARYDRQCRRVYANPKMIEELGGEICKILNSTPSEFPGGDATADYEGMIKQVLNDGQAAAFELCWQSAGGRKIVSYIRLTPEFSGDGEVVSVLAVGRDISEIDEYRRSIYHLAYYDSLTGLPNRALLVERMKQTFCDDEPRGCRFALMLLDLDHFKNINYVLGHDTGDLLLKAVSERLQCSTHHCDMVARLGGDEFAVLLRVLETKEEIACLANRLIDALEHPFQISARELFISTSIGIALYPCDSLDIDTLFRYADSALYHAKKLGRNNFQYYIPELSIHPAERLSLEASLRYACRNNEFELYYQAQVDLVSGKVVGVEALLRWNHPEQGIVTPDKFIPVAEESGLIVGIGEWVLQAACRNAVTWNTGRQTPLRVAVNLSTRQFLQNDLLSSVKRILQETQCRPEWLKLEITESLLLDDNNEILEVLNAFDAMGLKLAIDDFGTGYSALSYLNRFPVSQLKIDRSFVSNIPDDRNKSELVRAIIFIAQALSLELIAEGVETVEQAAYLELHGCLTAQGYLFGKPMRFDAFDAILKRDTE